MKFLTKFILCVQLSGCNKDLLRLAIVIKLRVVQKCMNLVLTQKPISMDTEISTICKPEFIAI